MSGWFTLTGASCSTIIGWLRPLDVHGARKRSGEAPGAHPTVATVSPLLCDTCPAEALSGGLFGRPLVAECGGEVGLLFLGGWFFSGVGDGVGCAPAAPFPLFFL